MGKGDEGSSFAETMNRAMQIPDDPGQGASPDLPQLFPQNFPIPHGELVVDNEPTPDDKRIKGVPKYRMRAHFQRFIMGDIVTMFNGEIHTDTHDDGPAYEEIQNKCLEGKAILCWEKTQFLKDGAVVIAMKWMTKHDPKEYRNLYGKDTEESEEAEETPEDIEDSAL